MDDYDFTVVLTVKITADSELEAKERLEKLFTHSCALLIDAEVTDIEIVESPI
jgi:hypothetical protein